MTVGYKNRDLQSSREIAATLWERVPGTGRTSQNEGGKWTARRLEWSACVLTCDDLQADHDVSARWIQLTLRGSFLEHSGECPIECVLVGARS